MLATGWAVISQGKYISVGPPPATALSQDHLIPWSLSVSEDVTVILCYRCLCFQALGI